MTILSITPPLINLNAVTKAYQTDAGLFMALKSVDLNINAGEFVAIVGKSGSGKTTLINMITGLDRPTDGEIIVGGEKVERLGENKLAIWRGRTIGVVFQFFQLLPTLTALENVMLPHGLLRHARLHRTAQSGAGASPLNGNRRTRQ